MLLFNPVKKFFRSLRSDATPNQLAMGVVIGMFLGMIPAWTVTGDTLNIIGVWWFMLGVLLLFNVSIAFAIISGMVFGGLSAIGLANLSYWMGWVVIEQWGSAGPGVASGPIGALVKMCGENSILSLLGIQHWRVMGALFFWLLLAAPVYFGSRVAVERLRAWLLRVATMKGVQFIRKSFILRWTLWFAVGNVLVATVEAGAAGEKLTKAKDQLRDEDKLKADLANKAAEVKGKKGDKKGEEAAEKVAALSDVEVADQVAGTELMQAAVNPLELAGDALMDLADDNRGEPVTVVVEEEVTDADGKTHKQLKIRKKKKIRRLRRSVMAAVFVLVVVPAIALAVLYFWRNQIVKWVMEGPVAEQIGMPITVGSVEVDLAEGRLRLLDVTIGPAPYDGEKPTATIEGVESNSPVFHAAELHGAIVPEELLSMRVHIDLQAVEPTLTLVRMPDGRMNYAGPEVEREAGELPTPEGELAEAVLNEAGEQVVDPETGLPLWRDPFSGEVTAAAEPPMCEPEEDPYDPTEGTTWDEVRKFIEEMVQKYELDDPDKNAERYAKLQELMEQYGPSAAAAAEKNPDVTKESLDAQLVGMASYITNPPMLPAPRRPSFWLKSLSLQDVSVRYIDTRPDGDKPMKQEHYTFDIRNITSNRMLIGDPLVVIVGTGLPATIAETLAKRSILSPHTFGKATEKLIAWRGLADDLREQKLRPANLMNCLVLRFDKTIQLNEIVGLFQGEDDEPLFDGGHIAIQTADPSFLKQNWRKIGDNWTFVGEDALPEGGMLEDGRVAIPGGEMAILGSKVEGVVILSLEDVRLNRHSLNMPEFLFDIIEQFLGKDYSTNWRFVIGLKGRFVGPSIRLLNEKEVTKRLRELAVRAVQKLTAKALEELLGKLLDREAFVARYGAGPEEFIVFEDSIPGADAVQAGWLKARGKAGNFRNVITPLLFVGKKKIFLNNLGYNAAPLGRAIVVDVIDDKAKLLLGKLLDVLPLPDGGLPDGVTRESLAQGMLDGVAEALVPDFTIDERGNLGMDTGRDYDARQKAALNQLRQNAARVTGIVLRAWIDAAAREIIKTTSEVLNGIPAEARPSAFRDSMGEIEDTLWAGVFESVQPEVEIDENFNFSVRFSQEDGLKTLRDRLVANTRTVLAKVTDAYVDDLAAEVERVIGVEAGVTGEEFRASVKANVTEKMFPLNVSADGSPNLRVDIRAGMNQLVANLAGVLPTIGVKLTDKLAGDAAKAIAQKVPGQLPGGWDVDRMLTTLRNGLAAAMFPPDCVSVTNNKVSIRPDTRAMEAALNRNVATVARGIGGDMSEALIGDAVTKVAGLFPSLPGGMTKDDVRNDLTDGVGAAIVSGTTIETLAFRPEAAGQALDRNAVKLTRKLAELGLGDMVQPIAQALIAEAKPRPEDYDANQLTADLTSGVGEAIVEGDTLAKLKLTPEKAINRLTINALTVARKLGSKALERMADELIRPTATGLGATDAQIRQAAARAAKDVDQVMFPDGSVTVDQNHNATVKAQSEAAKAKLEANVRVALADLVTQLLQKYVADIVKALNEPFMTPEEREHFKDRWMEIGRRSLPDGVGLAFINTDDRGKRLIQDAIRMAADPAIKDFQADLIIFRANKLCADNNVKFSPPLSSSELTAAERDDFYKAQNVIEQMDVIKKFLKRQDRVIDALGRALGMGPPNLQFLPQAQRDRAMKDYRDNIRKLIEKW